MQSLPEESEIHKLALLAVKQMGRQTQRQVEALRQERKRQRAGQTLGDKVLTLGLHDRIS